MNLRRKRKTKKRNNVLDNKSMISYFYGTDDFSPVVPFQG